MKLAFWQKKKHGRAKVDTIQPILKMPKKAAETRKTWTLSLQITAVIAGIALIFGFTFYGTLEALALKEKTDVLQLFKTGKYLIIFQNNDEIRPTGGFIGSFAVVTFRNYQVEQIDFNTNIYKLDNAFSQKNLVEPPDPLARVAAGHWTLRDANFSPDFPQAAKTIQWFYERETALSNERETALSNERETALSNGKQSGQKVDGVIAINASVIKDLLGLTGPIKMTKYDITVSADNFFSEMANKIEKEYFQQNTNLVENEPKTILKDLMPILLEKSLALSKMDLVKLIGKELTAKQILLQSNNQEIQDAILKNNWGGQIQSTTGDYLAINNANITDLSVDLKGGAKTSLEIQESVDYSVNNTRDGLVADLAITRSNTGGTDWPEGDNMDWMRILVPQGSQLEKAEMNGQDILNKIDFNQETGKTVFGLWIITAPGSSDVLKLTYKLPVTAENYTLLVQKQPGNLGDDFKASFNKQVLFNGVLDQDRFLELNPKKSLIEL